MLVQQRGSDLAELRAIVDSELRPRVEGVDAAIRDLRGAFTGIGSRVADLPGRQDIEGMIARAGTDTSALDERLESLQGWIEEVHAGLFAEDGVHPRVQALLEQAAESGPSDDIAAQIESRVDSAVRSAVAASEKRIAAHVDEAVLALAEALLRKRSRTGGVGLSAFDTGPIPVVPPAHHDSGPAPEANAAAPEDYGVADDHAAPEDYAAPPEDDSAPHEHAPAHEEPPAPSASALATEPVEALSPVQPAAPAHIDLGSGDGSSESAYQPATGPLGDGHDDLDDDDARRRRPWWRPGD